MAQLRLQPPAPFNLRNPDDWPRWKSRFAQFREASSLDQEADTKQVSTFLYCIGDEAEEVLASTSITDDERKVYETVVSKFDTFFKVRRNVIFERARFNQRNQGAGESAEAYIMELYRLAENCSYGELKDEMIRDRLVVGIRDSALSQRLQLDAGLTLEKAKKNVRQREAVGEQQQVLRGQQTPIRASTSSTVNAVTPVGREPARDIRKVSIAPWRRKQNRAGAVEKSRTLERNVRQRIKRVTSAKRRVISGRCVVQRTSLTCRAPATTMTPFSIRSREIRAQRGKQKSE